MHIPDGFLDLWICALMYVISAVVIGYSAVKLRDAGEQASSADWSGRCWHIRSADVELADSGWDFRTSRRWCDCRNPSRTLCGMSCDGFRPDNTMLGLRRRRHALGANIFNMGIVDVFVGYAVFKALRNFNQDVATFLAGWLGIWLAAIACGIEIGVSSIFKYEIGVTVPTMGIWHGILGIVEGIITMLVIRYIALRQPDIIYAAKEVVA